MANPFEKLAESLQQVVADASSLDHIIMLEPKETESVDNSSDQAGDQVLLSSQQNYNGDMVRVLTKESEAFKDSEAKDLQEFHSEMINQSQRFRLALIHAIGEIL